MKILKIKFSHQKDFNNFLKNDKIELSIIAETSDLGDVNITSYYYDKTLSVFSLDPNNFYILPDDHQDDHQKIKILAQQEGSGILKTSYRYLEENFYFSQQFICHDSFFKDNYLTYLFPTIDSQNISGNPFVKSIFDTLMEMIDILYAYNEDLKVIPSFTEGKSKFISLLSQNVGFERIDFTQFNTKYEYVNNETFREVVANMFDLLSIRGTKLAYELFFNALGYNTTIQEFWYDSDGNLIEINPDNELLSTYYAYTTSGTLISPALPRQDPRKNNVFLSNDYNNIDNNYIRISDQNGDVYYQPKEDVKITQKTNSYEQDIFKNNKSNYIRVVFDSAINNNFFERPQDFSIEKKLIIKRYLDFLRPSHIQYILETFSINFGDSSITTDEIDVLDNEDPNYDFLVGILEELTNSNEILEDINIVDLILNANDDESFNIGNVIFQNEEFSFSNRWDFLLKYDQEELYDYKDILNEELYVNGTRII